MDFPVYIYKGNGFTFLGVTFFDELFLQASVTDTHYRTKYHKIENNNYSIELNRINLSIEIFNYVDELGLMKFTGQCQLMPKPKI